MEGSVFVISFDKSMNSQAKTFLCALLLLSGFAKAQIFAQDVTEKHPASVRTGADQTEKYLPLLKDKQVAIVGNQTSLIRKTHLVDSLLKLNVKIKKIFCPEHGFRGTGDAGAKVQTQTDEKTGLPLLSLYGKNFKPKDADLKDVDVVLFDLQDVGARFYTYISTLHYVMEACAENQKPLIVLDRPNPNGYFIDGPVLEEKYKSFVGMHPVPVVYGMTMGEYARMINGEGWLNKGEICHLTVITLDSYSHRDYYELPVKPSPNLPNMSSIYLYPSLCFFEGTVVSVGRGTDKPFQVFGYPNMFNAKYSFTPHSVPGAENPPYKDKECKGYDVSQYGDIFMRYNKKLYLFWLITSYRLADDKEHFFNDYFNKLAGTDELMKQIKEGKEEADIRKSWEPAIKKFKETRKKYLLYKDFE